MPQCRDGGNDFFVTLISRIFVTLPFVKQKRSFVSFFVRMKMTVTGKWGWISFETGQKGPYLHAIT